MNRRSFITLLGCCCGVAGGGARATSGDAGRRIRQCRIIRYAPCRRVPQGHQ